VKPQYSGKLGLVTSSKSING